MGLLFLLIFLKYKSELRMYVLQRKTLNLGFLKTLLKFFIKLNFFIFLIKLKLKTLLKITF